MREARFLCPPNGGDSRLRGARRAVPGNAMAAESLGYELFIALSPLFAIVSCYCAETSGAKLPAFWEYTIESNTSVSSATVRNATIESDAFRENSDTNEDLVDASCGPLSGKPG